MKTITVYRCPPIRTLSLVAEIFEKHGLIAWSPWEYDVRRLRNGKLQKYKRAVMPSYLFVHQMHISELEAAHVSEIHRMKMNGEYVYVGKDELKQIKKGLFTFKPSYIIVKNEVGDSVAVAKGPFMGYQGTIAKITDAEVLVQFQRFAIWLRLTDLKVTGADDAGPTTKE